MFLSVKSVFLYFAYFFVVNADELVLLHAVSTTTWISSGKIDERVWRHGDRSPVSLIPADVNNTLSTWPQGMGELTPMGMRQEFDLGRVLFSRYATGGSVYELVSKNYTQTQIYVRSDDYNRTLMSAMANLAGFYANSTSGVIADGWPAPYWQPIPVHTIALNTDNLLYMDAPCPKVDQIYSDVVTKQENYTNVAEQCQPLLTYLDSVCGFSSPLTIDSVYDVWDPLRCELNHHDDGHDWPNFINDSIYENITECNDADDQYSYSNPQIARLRGGNLLGDIIRRMQQKQTSLSNTHSAFNWVRQLKYFMYSAHDDTLMAFLSTLGASSYAGRGYPDYSACALFELWKNDSNFFYVKSYYRKNSTTEFEYLQIDGCPINGYCSLDQFYQRSIMFIPVNWTEECAVGRTILNSVYSEKLILFATFAWFSIKRVYS